MEILAEAKSAVHVVTGALKNSGGVEVKGDSVIIYFGNEAVNYAAFEEFGTGDGVSVPQGFEDYAMTFKGTSSKKRNGQAHAYLFPAYLKRKDEIEKRLDAAVQKVLDKLKVI